MQKRTRSSLRTLVVTLLTGLLLPAGAQAQTPAPALEPEPLETSDLNPAAAVFDVLIVRPLGLVVVPVGVAAFIPAALITAPGGKESFLAALDYFVTGPTNFVFRRKLGEF